MHGNQWVFFYTTWPLGTESPSFQNKTFIMAYNFYIFFNLKCNPIKAGLICFSLYKQHSLLTTQVIIVFVLQDELTQNTKRVRTHIWLVHSVAESSQLPQLMYHIATTWCLLSKEELLWLNQGTSLAIHKFKSRYAMVCLQGFLKKIHFILIN